MVAIYLDPMYNDLEETNQRKAKSKKETQFLHRLVHGYVTVDSSSLVNNWKESDKFHLIDYDDDNDCSNSDSFQDNNEGLFKNAMRLVSKNGRVVVKRSVTAPLIG